MAPNWRTDSSLQSQGPLAPEILVTQAEHRAGDPDILPDAVIRFCNWCINEAWLVRDEVQPDAWLIYHSSYYVAQVRNGGHGQFAGNSAMKPEVLDDVEAGLDRLGLSDLLALFRRFRRALASDSALNRAVMEGGGFGEIPEVISQLDDAFFASPDPGRFHQQAAHWLKAAPTVVALTPREIRARQETIVASNKLLAWRRAASSRRSPGERFRDVAARLWGKTGLRRPGERAFDEIRRQAAERPNSATEVADTEAALISQIVPAVIDGDDDRVDQIFAGFRDLHARCRLDTTSRWPEHIRMYASKLHFAGERLGRPDLLEQAADAFGQTIATGSAYHYDPGFDWRSLGQALVELGRLDERRVPGVAEAVDAFARALAADAVTSDVYNCRVRSMLGRAEAHLVLAAKDTGPGHLDAARDALAEARPLLRPEYRNRWEVVNAELLSLSPPAEFRARERTRAIRQLDIAIAWETENDGDPGANPMRLKRLKALRAAIALPT